MTKAFRNCENLVSKLYTDSMKPETVKTLNDIFKEFKIVKGLQEQDMAYLTNTATRVLNQIKYVNTIITEVWDMSNELVEKQQIQRKREIKAMRKKHEGVLGKENRIFEPVSQSELEARKLGWDAHPYDLYESWWFANYSSLNMQANQLTQALQIESLKNVVPHK